MTIAIETESTDRHMSIQVCIYKEFNALALHIHVAWHKLNVDEHNIHIHVYEMFTGPTHDEALPGFHRQQS